MISVSSVALNGTSLTCETSGSRNNTIYCPNKGIHCTCESYDLTASKIYWLEPCDKILTLDTNHNVSHCEVEVKNCTSATVQANFNNSLSFKCAFNNDNMSCCACNKSNLNMTVTSNQRMPINIMCGLIRVAKIDGNSSLTLYPPGKNTIILSCNNIISMKKKKDPIERYCIKVAINVPLMHAY